MALVVRRYKKSAIGASSVTLIPTTAADDAILPSHLINSQIVVSTNATTPPSSFWGTAAADGKEYLVTIELVS